MSRYCCTDELGYSSGTQAAFWSSAIAPTGPLPNVIIESTFVLCRNCVAFALALSGV
jgi:hypothetical protein